MIELLILDVDGCMTDGNIVYTAGGDEIKAFNVKDGLAIVTWHRLGKRSAIITGRTSKIVERRAKELGIHHFYQNVGDKKAILEKILTKEGLGFEHVAAIGDDLNDYHMLKSAARSFTPADGVDFIQQHVDTVLTRRGGDACIREMIEILLREEGLEAEFLAQWL